jgi:hypothetical protein
MAALLPFCLGGKNHLLKRRKMKLRFPLAVLLLAACNASAMERPSKEKDTLLHAQSFVTDFGSENERPLELALLLGAMVFPVILICSHEAYQSIRARRLFPQGSLLPLPSVNVSRVSREVGNVHCHWNECIL